MMGPPSGMWSDPRLRVEKRSPKVTIEPSCDRCVRDSGLGDAARLDLESGDIVGVSVPLEGGVESLNAAVAGAIVLGEAQRQRLLAGRPAGVREGGSPDRAGVGGSSGPVAQ